MRKGNARPSPINKNVNKIIIGPEVKANARAVPINGAVQGVAKIVANTPFRKSPKFPETLKEPSRDPPGVVNSYRPKRFNEKANKASVMTATNVGDCS